MNNLVSRILLSILLLPSAIIVYVAAGVGLHRGVGSEGLTFFLMHVIGGLFVVAYWLALWYRSVRWTRDRKLWTGISGLLCLMAGIAFALFLSNASGIQDESFVIFFSGLFAIVSWLVVTVLLWRETAAERAERIRQSAGNVLFCPKCSYNMTGLYEGRCPECGTRYTLDQLYAAQQHETLEQAATADGNHSTQEAASRL